MARLVLVHGAFAGAWKWERLVPLLEDAGHTVETLDLPGSGDDQTQVADVNLDACCERVTAQLREREDPAVLVASSMGGVVCTQAAALASGRVAGIVYVAAFAPRDGQSLIDLTQLPEGAGDEVQANLVVEGDPPVGTMSVEAARGAAYLETSDADFEWALPQHRPQALQTFQDKAQVPAESLGGIPRAYVICTLDRSIPPPLQRRMIEENGIEHTAEIETDHSPMVSRPEELAAALEQLLTEMGVVQEAAR